jgi:hypothetical protein
MAYNYELIEKVLNKIVEVQDSDDKNEFNMGVYFRRDECGAVACIAGWTLVVENQEVPKYIYEVFHTARKKLGFSEEEADALFVDLSHLEEAELIAITILRTLLDDSSTTVLELAKEYL